jgi:hypothetical protein
MNPFCCYIPVPIYDKSIYPTVDHKRSALETICHVILPFSYCDKIVEIGIVFGLCAKLASLFFKVETCMTLLPIY